MSEKEGETATETINSTGRNYSGIELRELLAVKCRHGNDDECPESCAECRHRCCWHARTEKGACTISSCNCSRWRGIDEKE